MSRRRTLVACLALLAAACSSPPADAPVSEPRLDERRIVAMAPAAAEMLEAIGSTSSVVAIGDYVTRPASLLELPRVGAYDRPNVELVLSLEADLLVSAASGAAGPAHRRLETLGVEVLALDTSTFDGVFDSLASLGDAVGRRPHADRVATAMRTKLADVRRRAAGLPPRRVLVVVGRDPLFVAGPGSHVDELIELIGGENVAHDAGSPWARLSLETALEREPEVIVDASDNREGATRGATAGAWSQWPFLPAVRDDRVFHVHPDLISIPGVRLPSMAERLARFVHPERFGDAGDDDFVPADLP